MRNTLTDYKARDGRGTTKQNKSKTLLAGVENKTSRARGCSWRKNKMHSTSWIAANASPERVDGRGLGLASEQKYTSEKYIYVRVEATTPHSRVRIVNRQQPRPSLAQPSTKTSLPLLLTRPRAFCNCTFSQQLLSRRTWRPCRYVQSS